MQNNPDHSQRHATSFIPRTMRLGAALVVASLAFGGAAFASEAADSKDGDVLRTVAESQTLQVTGLTAEFGGLQCNGQAATIVATSLVTYGTPGNDVIVGRVAADDIISGLGGDDLICLGGGNDRASGGPGNDKIYGGSGNDLIRGGLGSDLLVGGSGADKIDGNSGSDLIMGGLGPDKLAGNGGNDRIWGNGGPDQISGGIGFDYGFGGPGIFDNCDASTEVATSC